MRTVRRLYFYLVTFISLEAMLWGLIQLVRTYTENFSGTFGTNLLARGLSLVLVGLPVFWLHWSKVQKDAQHEEEEQTSLIRAVFLYGVRLATLIPVFQNLLAIADRTILSLLGISSNLAWIGSDQNLYDNLIAIVINLLAWFYFGKILQKEAASPHLELIETRRVYRAVWILYGLILTLAGMHQVLRFVFSMAGEVNVLFGPWLGNGIALVLVGLPIWLYHWDVFRRTVSEPGEKESLLRMGLLFLITLVAATTSVLALANIITGAVRWLLGEPNSLGSFLSQEANSLAVLISFSTLWAYYGRELTGLISLLSDPDLAAKRQRLYKTILSLIGVIAVYFGTWLAMDTIIIMLLEDIPASEILRGQIGRGIASILVGLPLWLKTWLPLQEEASQPGEKGNLARQSTERRAYLYLILFATVIGGMFAAGWLLYFIISSLLGGIPKDFWIEVAHRVWLLGLTVTWLIYHLNILRKDDRLIAATKVQKQAIFPTLIFQGSEGADFSALLLSRLQRQMPRLPAAVCNLESDCLDDTVSATKLAVLPVNLAANPPESLRTWLAQFSGERILVPLAEEKWIYLGSGQRSQEQLTNDTIRVIRQVVEGEKVQGGASPGGWNLVGIILASLFGLFILFNLLGLLFSSFD